MNSNKSLTAKFVTTDEIKSWNNLTRNSIRTGQMLRVTTTSAIADATGAKSVAPAKSETKAQTSKQSRRNEQTAQNSKKSDKKTKDTKKAKDTKATPSKHSVKSGENLTTIAKKYGTTVSELKKANGLTGDEIHPGDALKLPSKSKASSKSSKSRKSKKKRR